MEAFKAVDPKAAEAEAQAYWISQAKEIVEPTKPEIVDSARMFLAVKNLMIQQKAQAICSRHCMGNPRGCLTFSKLNDLGFVGGCEGDIDSTLTMLLFDYAFHVPGFISDPVIDTAKNAVIHFHCTSATKMDGPNGCRLPFQDPHPDRQPRRRRFGSATPGGTTGHLRQAGQSRCDADLSGQDHRDQHEPAGLPHAIYPERARRPPAVPQLGRAT